MKVSILWLERRIGFRRLGFWRACSFCHYVIGDGLRAKKQEILGQLGLSFEQVDGRRWRWQVHTLLKDSARESFDG